MWSWFHTGAMCLLKHCAKKTYGEVKIKVDVFLTSALDASDRSGNEVQKSLVRKLWALYRKSNLRPPS